VSNYEIECDKCGSHSVVQRLAAPPKPPEVPVIKMSEFKDKRPVPNTMSNAVMTYSTVVLHCNNCGNETEPFTLNDQLGTTVVGV
jgi:uncharacterized Zn finger protein